MTKTTNLNPKANENYRLFRKFSTEAKAVTISGISLVIAVLSLLMAWMAVYDAINAKTQVDVALDSNADLKKEVRLLQMKVDRYDAKLEAGDK